MSLRRFAAFVAAVCLALSVIALCVENSADAVHDCDGTPFCETCCHAEFGKKVQDDLTSLKSEQHVPCTCNYCVQASAVTVSYTHTVLSLIAQKVRLNN